MLFRFINASKNNFNHTNFNEINISGIDATFIKSISLTDLYSFMNFLEMKENKNGASARGRKVSAIKSFFKYLQNKEKIISVNENLALELEKTKLGKRKHICLSLEEGKSLINSIEKGYYNSKRDLCILTLLLNCGLRREEVSSL